MNFADAYEDFVRPALFPSTPRRLTISLSVVSGSRPDCLLPSARFTPFNLPRDRR